MRERYVVLVTTTPALHGATRELASRLASRAHAVLLFLHVIPVRAASGDSPQFSRAEAAAGPIDAWLHEQTPSDPSVRFRHLRRIGAPVEVVRWFVKGHDVELVVAEEPPRGRLSSALWRSLSQRLVQELACPVVVGGPGFRRGQPPSPRSPTTKLPDTTVAELLNVMVEARVQALCSWMDHLADDIGRLAGAETIGRLSQGDQGAREASLVRRIRVQLGEHGRASRAVGWQLTLGEQRLEEQWSPIRESRALSEFLDRVRLQGSSTSLPVERAGQGSSLAVLAGAQVPDTPGGMLLFAFDASPDFLRILGQPGPLPTFETYAFDADGLMLSNSRFPDHLASAGLLGGSEQTPLRLRVAVPSRERLSTEWRLTHSAEHAINHRDGFNTEGYFDYRGTTVIGAWRWVARYGFGVAAEVDRDVVFG